MMINHGQVNYNLSWVEGLLLPFHHAFILLTFCGEGLKTLMMMMMMTRTMMVMMINHGQVNYSLSWVEGLLLPSHHAFTLLTFCGEGLKTLMMVMMINHGQVNYNFSWVEGLLLPFHHAFILLTFYSEDVQIQITETATRKATRHASLQQGKERSLLHSILHVDAGHLP